MEALVKRIDGLEKRLKEEGKAVDKDSENGISVERGDDDNSKPERPIIDTEIETLDETAVYSPTPTAVRYVNYKITKVSIANYTMFLFYMKFKGLKAV